MSQENILPIAQVIASIAHDLRSPLNAVIGFSRVMLKGIDGPLSEMQADDLEAIYVNGNAMLSMVDNLIDLAKVEAGWLTPNKTAFHVQPLLEKARALAGHADRCTIVYPQQKALPLAWADQPQIQRALETTLAAGLHFASTGHLQVRVCPDQDGVHIDIQCSAPEGLAPDTDQVLQSFASAGALRDSRMSAVSLALLTGKLMIQFSGGLFSVTRLSEEEIVLSIVLPTATPD
jgi:K+-sensing histidine kinase KdpD